MPGYKYGQAERVRRKAPPTEEAVEGAITKGDVKAAIAALRTENELLRQQVVDLDEMPRKRTASVSDLKGIEDIPTSITKRVRSMPGGEDKLYLELYLMQKEQHRLKKETTWVKKRRTRIGLRFEDNTKEIAKREKTALESMSVLQAEADDVKEEAADASGAGKKYVYAEKKALPGMKTQPAEY